MSAPALAAGGWRFPLRAGIFLHRISGASKQSPHLRHQESHREPQLSSIAFVWVFLCADEAGCGWLRPVDDRVVTHIGAPPSYRLSLNHFHCLWMVMGTIMFIYHLSVLKQIVHRTEAHNNA